MRFHLSGQIVQREQLQAQHRRCQSWLGAYGGKSGWQGSLASIPCVITDARQQSAWRCFSPGSYFFYLCVCVCVCGGRKKGSRPRVCFWLTFSSLDFVFKDVCLLWCQPFDIFSVQLFWPEVCKCSLAKRSGGLFALLVINWSWWLLIWSFFV